MRIGRWKKAAGAFGRPKAGGARGFTLIELMIVMVLIMILAAMAVPTYEVAVTRAREAVLKDDLFTMRKLIDQYTLDKQQPPESLDDLVQAGYLRGGLPVDPFTGSNQTWQTDTRKFRSPRSRWCRALWTCTAGRTRFLWREPPTVTGSYGRVCLQGRKRNRPR